MKVLTSKSTKQYKDKFILCIGGGSVIDRAKIQAKKEGKYLIAIPTTGSGSSETSHAVVWTDVKSNVPCPIPSTILPPFPIKLSKLARRDTVFDIIGHLIDTLYVCSDEDVVKIGCQMGKWIEKYPTGLTHKPSYHIKIAKNRTHGASVGLVLCDAIRTLWEGDDIA